MPPSIGSVDAAGFFLEPWLLLLLAGIFPSLIAVVFAGDQITAKLPVRRSIP